MILKKYENLFQEKEKKEILLVLSLGFRNLLKIILKSYDDEIARFLLLSHKKITSRISFIDRSKDINKITYIDYDRVIPYIKERDLDPFSEDIYNIKTAWLDKRQDIGVGRFINRLTNDFNSIQIELFINRFKAESKKDVSGLVWERVHGSNINKWYLSDNYVKGGGTLNRSCLRKKDRNIFLNFLAGNPNSCRLLLLKNDKNLLLGRALVWRLTEPNRFFLDRVYTRFDEDVNLFIESAKKNGWLFKSKQTFGGEIPITDGRTGEEKWIKMVVDNFKKRNFGGYPYMDTFQYYDTDNEIITNDNSIFINNDKIIKLNKVDGTYTKYDDRHIDQGDMLE